MSCLAKSVANYSFNFFHLTTVALCVSKLSSDEVLHPERLTDTSACEWVTLAVAGTVQLADCGGKKSDRVLWSCSFNLTEWWSFLQWPDWKYSGATTHNEGNSSNEIIPQVLPQKQETKRKEQGDITCCGSSKISKIWPLTFEVYPVPSLSAVFEVRAAVTCL